jgi:hypothetical protein
MVPDVVREAEVLVEVKAAADRVVSALAAEAQRAGAGPHEVTALSAFAGRELEEYASTLLSTLLVAASGARDADGAAWVQRHFHACLGEVGLALRDAIKGSTTRHAVAQILQRKVFEAENELRAALATGLAPGAPARERMK